MNQKWQKTNNFWIKLFLQMKPRFTSMVVLIVLIGITLEFGDRSILMQVLKKKEIHKNRRLVLLVQSWSDWTIFLRCMFFFGDVYLNMLESYCFPQLDEIDNVKSFHLLNSRMEHIHVTKQLTVRNALHDDKLVDWQIWPNNIASKSPRPDHMWFFW